MPVRTLVVWCPDWPVVAAGVALDVPAAVLHANRVVACSPAARAEDVVVGLRRREAQGRCPSLLVLERDPGLEARRFEPVLAAVESLTPRVEVTTPGTCAFATRGPSRYFGGDESLAHRVAAVVAEALAGRGEVTVGVADGPFAARLAARGADTGSTGPRVVPPGESAAFLAPLPAGQLLTRLPLPHSPSPPLPLRPHLSLSPPSARLSALRISASFVRRENESDRRGRQR